MVEDKKVYVDYIKAIGIILVIIGYVDFTNDVLIRLLIGFVNAYPYLQ